MTTHDAAHRIVEIQGFLSNEILGPGRTANLFEEQRELWDEFFLGKPYEAVLEIADAPASGVL